LGAAPRPVVARPGAGALEILDPERRRAYEAAIAILRAGGCEVVDLDLDPFLEAGQLLYQGAFVAERYAAVGAWIAVHPDEVDPTVGAIISAAATLGAPQLASDLDRLSVLRRRAAREWQRAGAHSLLLPTVTRHPTLAEVASDPVGVNTQMGRFTTFLNLLDMCAVAVPFGMSAGLPFGLSCIGPAFTDLVQSDIASRLEQGGLFPAASRPIPRSWQAARALRPAPPGIALGVVGAHLTGQPLNHQLTDRGGRLLGATTTTDSYRLLALDTVPAKPGLVRVSSGGAAIAVEIWELSPAGFGDFVAQVPQPMVIGSVELVDGSFVSCFLCEPAALQGAVDITHNGGWLAYLGAS
jgi:allophanate hydrolase